MNIIKLKDINILDIIKDNNQLLTVKEFLLKAKYDIDKLYFDKL